VQSLPKGGAQALLAPLGQTNLMARAFDLYAQGERNADRSQGGLGIGLARVKNLIELHGGKVAAHSDGIGIGRGSDFTVTLPLSAVN
jgi:signal transduction histidine kinase